MKLVYRLFVRRAFPSLLAIMILFFSGYGCSDRSSSYTYAEGFYKRYITEHKELGITYDKELAHNWCSYARYPDKTDFGAHNLPDDIYDYPVNLGAYYQEDGIIKFKNNADTIAELGDEGVMEIIANAEANWNRIWSADYRAMDKEAYRLALLWYYSPYLKDKSYMSDWVDDVYDHQYILSSAFVGDPSTVYKAADGSYRVRGIGYMQFHQSIAPTYVSSVEVGKPYMTYVEFGFWLIDDDDKTPAWEHGKWHTTIYWRFTPWTESTDESINKTLAILPIA